MHCFFKHLAPTFHKGIEYKNDRENAKKVGGIPQHHLHHYEVHGRHKDHRRDGSKANQLKMIIFWHQEDRKSTDETKTKQINLKQINLRWEFFDTKAHKKTERAPKRQKQSKST